MTQPTRFLIDPVTVRLSKHDLESLVAAAHRTADELEQTARGTTRKAEEKRLLAESYRSAAWELEGELSLHAQTVEQGR